MTLEWRGDRTFFKILLGCGVIAHVNLIREAFITECVRLETITSSLVSYALFIFIMTLESHIHLVN